MGTIPCDHCGAEVEKLAAFTVEVDGQTYYFCSVDCYEEGGDLELVDEEADTLR
jgi:ribosomal protein L24E